MDFFAHQEKARKRTTLLIVYFVVAVASIVAAVYLASLLVFNRGAVPLPGGAPPSGLVLWDPRLFTYVALGTLGVVALGSLYKTIALAKGGSAVAESLGGRLLDRDELQGVVGHEFSHLLNGDMRLNIRLMAMLFGILCLAVIGRLLIYTRAGHGRGRAPMMLLGIALIGVGSIGVLFGRLIQAAVSRQRELLADASAVQFTRNPAGLSSALQKIGSVGSTIGSAHAGEANHMFFENGLGKPLGSLLATHPPLASRIRAIDPSWDGKLPPVGIPA